VGGKGNDKNLIIIAFVILLILLGVVRIKKLVINLGFVQAELEFPPTPTSAPTALTLIPTGVPPSMLKTGPTSAPFKVTLTPVAVLPSVSPLQAVRDYYVLINQREYNIAWSMLSNHFKDKFNCCTPEGYYDFKEYKRWWDSVAWVDVGEIKIIKQNGNTAVVFAQLSYLMKNGSRIVDYRPYIWLVFEPTTNIWLFYDKGPSP
jgi:hypothetical protein